MSLAHESYRRLLGPSWAPVGPARLRRAVAGRVVLVTGASSGIGAATAEACLGSAGAIVLLAARREALLDELVARIASAGGSATAYVVDLAELERGGRLVAEVLADHGRVDVVVSNAGKSIRRSLSDTEDRFHDVTRTNAVNYLGTRAAAVRAPAVDARPRLGPRRGRQHRQRRPPDRALGGLHRLEGRFRRVAALRRSRDPRRRHRDDHDPLPLVHTPMSAPTYDPSLPGLTADQAAEVVGRALVTRPRLLSFRGGFACRHRSLRWRPGRTRPRTAGALRLRARLGATRSAREG